MPEPYYTDDLVTLYHGDSREILPTLDLGAVDLVLTDPPYPNKADHFTEHVEAAETVLRWLTDRAGCVEPPRFMVFWHQLSKPPVGLPLVAHHVWHRTNTNRPDNYEPIYEFAHEPERPSVVFPFAVIAEGLTGCHEATGHPTQKNVKLIQRLIQLRNATFVLDPFSGSGTTLEAAKRLGVRAIGIELEERWCAATARRLAQDVLDLGMAA